MIRSMTAYSRREIKDKWGRATWEIYSVNQRYLEICFRMPEQFRNLEPIVRKRIHTHLIRGKIECNLRVKLDIANIQGNLILNKTLVKQLINAANWINSQSSKGKEIDPVSILQWPDVITIDEQDQDLNTITNKILIALNDTLNDLIIVRETEGQAIKAMIEQRLKGISTEIAKIRAHIPKILQWQHECLITKLKKAEIQLDNNRLEQELILTAQRTDVSEELDRLEAHLNETYNILKKKEPIGRRLDFMMQEFNRESNTLASKSINVEVTNSAIELKVLIEQIREQIQNIE